MNELEKNIIQNRPYNDCILCDALLDIVRECNIQTEKELEEYEDSLFCTTDVMERIKILYCNYLVDYIIDFKTINAVTIMHVNFILSDNVEDKAKFLLKVYGTLGWEMCLPYQAYKLLIKHYLW